jgi:glycerol-3-phosphate dehydrogenase
MINLAGMCSPGLSSAPAVGEEAARLLSTVGLELNAKENFKDERPPVVHLASMSADEKRALIAKNPAYGKIICRCETVTEGEIVDAIHRPITPRSIDAVKRRCRAGMGRCQGGFCSPRVHELISRELGIPMEDIPLDKDGSFIITGKTKA